MRIAVIDTYYREFLASHYAGRRGLERQPYQRQLASLLERMFGTFDAYTSNLRALGHDAVNIIVNCQPLQARWAAEHGLQRRVARPVPFQRVPQAYRLEMRRLRRIALAQIEHTRTEIVFVHGLASFPRADLERMRAQGCLVVGQIASPVPSHKVVEGYDLILSSFPHFVDRFRAAGIASDLFRLGFDTSVLDRLRAEGTGSEPQSVRPYPAVFVGGLHPRMHGSGVALLEHVCRYVDVEIWGYGAQALPRSSPIRDRFRGQVWGLDMFRTFARSRIVINRHIAASEGYANNMRLYEATGTGALVMTEEAPNLSDILEPGVECVTYRSADELVEKLRYYLANEDERVTIAAAGQTRTLREHSYAQRMIELDQILRQRSVRATARRPVAAPNQ